MWRMHVLGRQVAPATPFRSRAAPPAASARFLVAGAALCLLAAGAWPDALLMPVMGCIEIVPELNRTVPGSTTEGSHASDGTCQHPAGCPQPVLARQPVSSSRVRMHAKGQLPLCVWGTGSICRSYRSLSQEDNITHRSLPSQTPVNGALLPAPIALHPPFAGAGGAGHMHSASSGK